MSVPRAIIVLLAMPGCGGDVIELGSGDAVPSFGDVGQSVRNLNTVVAEEYDPTLTDDLLEIFFVSDRLGGVGNKDVWHAQRLDRRDPFDAPNLVREASSPAEEASAAISGDGLTLWVGSRREGGLGGADIWRLTRSDRRGEWNPPEHLEALNSGADDLPRPPGQGGNVLPIASDRDGSLIQTYFATRAGPHQEFEVRDPVVDYLWVDDSSMEDGFLSDDGLHLFFRRALVGGNGDLYVTWRKTIHDLFQPPISLDAVNTAEDERDPYVSADRARFFFASTRSNGFRLDVYATSLYLPTYR